MTSIANITRLTDRRRTPPCASMRLQNGLWTTTRTIAGERITFEAPTQHDLAEAIRFTVNQQLEGLNTLSAVAGSDPAAPATRSSIFAWLGRLRLTISRMPRSKPFSLMGARISIEQDLATAADDTAGPRRGWLRKREPGAAPTAPGP